MSVYILRPGVVYFILELTLFTYILSLDYIEKDPDLQWVGNANELNAVSHPEATQFSQRLAWENVGILANFKSERPMHLTAMLE